MFLYPHGVAYILENPVVQRVKVGMTGIGVNNVADRLRDINDMWLERKISCQICAGRLVNAHGLVPFHVVSGNNCPGGRALPLERSVELAESHLQTLRDQFCKPCNTEKASICRKIRTLETRIQKYRHHELALGEWQFRVAFDTDGVAEVESSAHRILAKHLDASAPFGEVFCCSVSEATEAVETAMKAHGVFHSAKRRMQL
jgi:hypothetical protein